MPSTTVTSSVPPSPTGSPTVRLTAHAAIRAMLDTTVAQSAALLAVYSAGLALPFLLVGIAFDLAMGAFRWVRDRYDVLRVVSGALLVALGLLIFFDRRWWLNVAFNRALEFFGIGV